MSATRTPAPTHAAIACQPLAVAAGLSPDRPSHHMAASLPDGEEGNRLYAVGYYLPTASGRKSKTRLIEFVYATSDNDAFSLCCQLHRGMGVATIWMDSALPVYPAEPRPRHSAFPVSEHWPAPATADPLTPFRAAVAAARATMEAITGNYPAYRNAQADYTEAVATLRAAERNLDPEAADRHYLTA